MDETTRKMIEHVGRTRQKQEPSNMARRILKAALSFMIILPIAANSGPNEIAVPAFTLSQSYDLEAATITDKLASALSRESGYMVFHQAELASLIDPEIVAKINIEDVPTLVKVGVHSGTGYVLAGDIEMSGKEITLLAKLIKTSDSSVLLNLSECVNGTVAALKGRIAGIVAKICTVLPPLSDQTNPASHVSPQQSAITQTVDSMDSKGRK
jgi:hypothetical protein